MNTKKFKAIITVKIKPTIKDIKTITLKEAVSDLLEVKNFNCSIDTQYNLTYEAEDMKKAKAIAQMISDEILSNSVIENYDISMEEIHE